MLPILLIAQNSSGRKSFIRTHIKKLNVPQHRVFVYEPEKTTISIEQIRDVSRVAQSAGSELSCIVIHAFDTAKPEAQSAFLKTLEEKSETTQFILCVNDESSVLPTIRSRSRAERLQEDISDSQKYFQKYKFDTVSSEPAWMSASAKVKKEHALPLIDEIITSIRRYGFASDKKLSAAKGLTHIIETRSLIQKNNINYEYALDSIGHVLSENKLFPLLSG